MKLSSWAVLSSFAFASLIASVVNAAEPALVNVRFSPENPQKGEQVTAFIEAGSLYNSPEPVRLVLSGKVDGQDVALLHPSDSLWIASLGPYTRVGTHQLQVEALLVDINGSQPVIDEIAQIEARIAELNEQIPAEMDPEHKSELEAELVLKTARRAELALSLPGFEKSLGTDTFEVKIAPVTDMDALQRSIVLAQNRTIITQNSDGGWDYDGSASSHLDTSNASYPNLFGPAGIGLVMSYDVTHEIAVLGAIQKTANYFMTKTIGRTSRLYSLDALFLAEAALRTGSSAYRQQAELALQADKNFAGAMVVLGNYYPDPVAVNALPQEQIDAVSDTARVDAYFARFAGNGRNAGLLAYDFQGWVRRSLALDDRAFALVVARRLAVNYASIAANEANYLLGLSNTITALAPFVADEPAFSGIIQEALGKMLETQGTDGLFASTPQNANGEGDMQDQAFIIQALRVTEQVEPLNRLLTALFALQAPWGGFEEAGNEYMETLSVYLENLTQLWLQGGRR